MPVTYGEIKRYSNTLKQVTDSALKDLRSGIARAVSATTDPYTRAYAIRRHIAKAAEKYGLSAQELGAQWYEYCAQKAGVDVSNALISEIDYRGLDAHFENLLNDYAQGNETWDKVEPKIRAAFEDEIRSLSRQAIIENLDRDDAIARRSGRTRTAGYARVPVGETCAWCFMLASLGYYYRSYESAGGVDPDHYHAHCDCVVVGYNDPDTIEGYDDYPQYLQMYEDARETFRNGAYSQETAERIEKAKGRHDKLYENGQYKNKWTDYNAITIIMREQNGLEH